MEKKTLQLNGKSKKKIGCLQMILIFLVAIFVGFIALVIVLNNTGETTNLSTEMVTTETTKAQYARIEDCLNSCGVKCVSIEYDELLDGCSGEGTKGYRITTKKLKNVILYLNEDKSVNCIRYADYNLYDNNTVIAKLDSFILSNEKKSNLNIQCIEIIKSMLRSPSEAKFPSILKWNMWKVDNKIFIESYFDAPNALGTTVRSEFQFILEDNTFTSLIIDGQQMYEQNE